MVLIDLFSVVGVDSYKRSCTSQSPMLVELLKAHFESADCAARPVPSATKEAALREKARFGVFQACLRKSISDICGISNKTVRNVSSQLIGYHGLVSKFWVTDITDLREKKEDINQAQQKLLKRVKGSKKQKTSW